jgi:cytochrome c peroxidase
MKKYIVVVCICIVITIPFSINSCSHANNNNNIANAFKHYYNKQIEATIANLSNLQKAINQKNTIQVLQHHFLQSRLSYKKVEAITEYYFQGLTKRINGAALPDIKVEDGVVWPPHGFQVIEQLLFSTYTDSLTNTITNEINVLKTDLQFTIAHLKETSITPQHIQELVQHQIIRVATLGITGFDTPLSQYALQETASSLEGLLQLIQQYAPQKILEQATAAIAYVKQHANIDSFNRLAFLVNHLMPLSDAIATLQKDTSMPSNQPYYGGLSQLLKGKAFNADYFANYAIAASNKAKIELGKNLFYDKTLSSSKRLSCASCHNEALYFTDGKIKAANFLHGGLLERNTPTILYAGFQNNQFYDLRSVSLEDQVNEVMNNKNEFALSSTAVTKNLSQNAMYTKLFAEAFGAKDTISSFFIRNAIAAYIRSLSSFSSPFDQYINGNTTALSTEQIQGFNLFAGKAKCATCHFIPLFNGTTPPWYNKTESEVIGVPQKAVWKNATIDADSGRYKINAFSELLYAFKTPTLRNIEKTAPYMHNGVYKTLDEVVEFYHKGGGVGIGIKLPNQTLPFDSLQLSSSEKKAIVAFMNSLTDKKGIPK